METKKLSEVAILKLQNCNLRLQVLQLQASLVLSERDKVLTSELERLGCNSEEWQLDETTWELVKK